MRHLAAQLGERSPRQLLASPHLADLFLACACAHHDAAAVQLFREKYLAHLPAWVRRVDASPAFADEVRQTVMERLLVGPPPRIGQYTGRGELSHWLRVVTLRTAYRLSQHQRRSREAEREWKTEMPLPASNPEKSRMRSDYREQVRSAFARAQRQLPARARQILRLHFVDGVNLDQIGKVHGVNRSTVSRWVASARTELLQTMQDQLRASLNVDAGELDSIFRLLGSQLEISLGTLMESVAG